MIFIKDAKNFYREVGKEIIIVNEIATIEDVKKFWKMLWSEEKGFTKGSE